MTDIKPSDFFPSASIGAVLRPRALKWFRFTWGADGNLRTEQQARNDSAVKAIDRIHNQRAAQLRWRQELE